MAGFHKKPFIQVATKGKDDWFNIYQKGDVNSYEPIAGAASLWLFYLRDNSNGKIASNIYSHYQENEAASLKPYQAIRNLFKASLYRSLARQDSEALKLWQYFINMRHETFSIDALLKQNRAEYLVVNFCPFRLSLTRGASILSTPAPL